MSGNAPRLTITEPSQAAQHDYAADSSSSPDTLSAAPVNRSVSNASYATSYGEKTAVDEDGQHYEKYNKEVDNANVEAGGIKMPTKMVPPVLPTSDGKKPGFIGRLFGKKAKKDDDEEGEKKAHYIPAAIPDPPREQMGVFDIMPSTLDSLVDPKSVDKVTDLGGIDGVVSKLHTNLKTGLDESAGGQTSIDTRRKIYGENRLPERKSKSLFMLMWIALQDKVLVLLSVAAVISLALGIYQAVGTEPTIVEGVAEPQVEWVEGVAIIVAISEFLLSTFKPISLFSSHRRLGRIFE